MSESQQRHECPEPFCIAAFRRQELATHLQWDHGYSEFTAKKMANDELEEA